MDRGDTNSSDNDEDAQDLLSRFQVGGKASSPKSSRRELNLQTTPSSFTSINKPVATPHKVTRNVLQAVVLTRKLSDTAEFQEFERWRRVTKILRTVAKDDDTFYVARYGDNHEETLAFAALQDIPGALDALEHFDGNEKTESEVSDSDVPLSSRTSRLFPDPSRHVRFSSRTSRRAASTSSASQIRLDDTSSSSTQSTSSDDDSEGRSMRRRRSKRSSAQQSKKQRTRPGLRARPDRLRNLSDSAEDSEELFIVDSNVQPPSRKRKRHTREKEDHVKRFKTSTGATRHSARTLGMSRDMQEIDEDRVYRSSSSEPAGPSKPRLHHIRETFRPGQLNSLFRLRHINVCETCGMSNSSSALVCCQGCTMSYHQSCLGTRVKREHRATKIGHSEFVLQCRRCIEQPRKKERTAPRLSRCSVCREQGQSCRAFSKPKTLQQEELDREANGGEDPITQIPDELINNAAGLLFRCAKCVRGFHFHCLPNRNQYHQDLESATQAELAESRFFQYRNDWYCKDCADMPAEVGGLVAWRPVDIDISQNTSLDFADIEEDEKEYLVKWRELSYARSEFMPGAWVWGVTMPNMRVAFAKKETGPKLRIEDAIPEEYLRIDIILDVEYTNRIDIRTEEVDKARIKEVKRVYIKYKGLGYEEAVWEIPPTPEDGDRWTDYVTAYDDWVLGRWIKLPKPNALRARVEKVRDQPFEKIEKQQQPTTLIGGEMMGYQLEGLNWLYYRWHQKQNGILADEMGLGKTIQVIAFLALMLEDHNCCPFLIVVPNSTCPNWRREIKKWAPSLRVVAYYGSAAAREIAYKHELFPEGSKSLKTHVVITSYEAAADGGSRRFFKNVPWQGLIVDEGQRIKNDQSLLHQALKALKIPFRILLTGTPLQNNAKELFNLLEFLDDTINAEQLEEEYTDMNDANIRKLHELIRPFILRRTKAGVLGFLPPMAQIILPVSMTPVQKKVYMSILEKNPELLKALFSRNKSDIGKTERTNLNNILMQLRKCLCHPFVYSRQIEELNLGNALLHRNLVEASAKLKLLDVLLPKLKERGHRVLMFSQFLDMLDIIEDLLVGLGMKYERLDGSMNSLDKQKRIDRFNAEGSELFAFLLSTRSGGVGINLATADTVIILDPDFNPHQDIQALSRAHRIGQKKKVLCFQLMTRSSAEEKIMQIGRRKMALDHVIVEQMDNNEAEEKDLGSILRHGAAELFTDNDEDNEIKYDDASIEKLLDRSQIEKMDVGVDKTAESQFSFARVWANETGALQDELQITKVEEAPDPFVWDKILKERERAAAIEAAARQQTLGRGKRARVNVDYNGEDAVETSSMPPEAQAEPSDNPAPSAVVAAKRKRASTRHSDESDTDFQPADDKEDIDDERDGSSEVDGEVMDIDPAKSRAGLSGLAKPPQSLQALQTHEAAKSKPKQQPKQFQRAQILPPRLPQPVAAAGTAGNFDHNLSMLWQQNTHGQPHQTQAAPPAVPSVNIPPIVSCPACSHKHHRGSCPLKLAGVEYCNLCGLAHYGHARTCLHINSETQVVLMIEAVKNSREPFAIREAALKYLKGLKGNLVQLKKRTREKALEAARNPAMSGPKQPAYGGPYDVANGASAPRPLTSGSAAARDQPVLTPSTIGVKPGHDPYFHRFRPADPNSPVDGHGAQPNGSTSARQSGVVGQGISQQSGRPNGQTGNGAQDVENRLWAALGRTQ